MKPTNVSVFDLFQMERRYIVPLFQRPYVWSRETQWAPLWDDINDKVEEVLQWRDDDVHPLRKHFLGATVINQIRTFGFRITAMEVIDGQQRLTTLQILLCALKDYAVSQGNQEVSRTLERITENNLSSSDNSERYKVWPTSSDRAVYEAVFQAGSPQVLRSRFPLQYVKYARKPLPRPRLAEAYLFFYEAIETYVGAEDLSDSTSIEAATDAKDSRVSEKRLRALLDAIILYFEVVVIELEERDDPQVIFETLNARGEPLLPSDLIRNFVFLEATRQKKNVTGLYEQYWREFDGNGEQHSFWKQEQTQGRLRRPRFDLFVFHYLTEQTERQLPIKHLYQEFRDWWLRSQVDVETGLESLQSSGTTYRQFFDDDVQNRLGVFCHRINQLDTGTIYPLLLFLTSEQVSAVPSVERDVMLTELESYMVRRLVCGLTPKDYNNVFLQLLRELKKAQQIDRRALHTLLAGLQGESRRWPDDAEFRSAWLRKPIYHLMSAKRVSMILEALDLQMETSKQEKLHIASFLTVEHIMPQSWNEAAWPLVPASSDSPAYEEQIARRNGFIQTFGNLTLLTQPLNSSVSNGSFARKRPEIAIQSRLRLNAYFQNFDDSAVWDEVTILARGKALFTVAKEIWPGPDA